MPLRRIVSRALTRAGRLGSVVVGRGEGDDDVDGGRETSSGQGEEGWVCRGEDCDGVWLGSERGEVSEAGHEGFFKD